MAVSTTQTYDGQDYWNRHRVAVVTVAFDTSYPSGGEAWDWKNANNGITSVLVVIPLVRYSSGATGGAGRIVQYDYTNKKLVVFEDGATVAGQLDEVPDTTDLSGLVVDVIVVGS